MASPSKARMAPVWGTGDINWAVTTETYPEDVKAPTQAYDDDAGFDLYVSEPKLIQPGDVVDVPCGVALELPSNVWVMLVGRSSTLRKRRLLVNTGIIDSGYRGELFAGVMNVSNEEVVVSRGERLAQLIFMPNLSFGVRLNQVESLEPHDRGSNGFGSSGA